MSSKPYRVEVDYPSRGNPRYFLVKDVKVGNKKRKVRRYLGTTPLTTQDVEQARRRFGPDIEMKAAKKRAELSEHNYKSDMLQDHQIRILEELRYIYAAVLELLTANETAAYEKEFEITYIQGTTAIEGNTLSLAQASDLLEYGLTPQGKKLREINEVQNFKKVITYRNRYKKNVTLEFIKRLHALVMDNIDNDSAGSFRRSDDVTISGCEIPVCPSVLIEEELQKIIDEYYRGLEEGRHPFELAIMFHYKFEMIHPFVDGNGRVGREVLNFMLARAKFPRLLFLGKDREFYINALRRGNKEDYNWMVGSFWRLITDQRLKVMSEKLQALAGSKKKSGQMSLSDFVDSKPVSAASAKNPAPRRARPPTQPQLRE